VPDVKEFAVRNLQMPQRAGEMVRWGGPRRTILATRAAVSRGRCRRVARAANVFDISAVPVAVDEDR